MDPDGTVVVEAMDGETAVDKTTLAPDDVDLNAIWDAGLALADRYDMGDDEGRAREVLMMAGVAMAAFVQATRE